MNRAELQSAAVSSWSVDPDRASQSAESLGRYVQLLGLTDAEIALNLNTLPYPPAAAAVPDEAPAGVSDRIFSAPDPNEARFRLQPLRLVHAVPDASGGVAEPEPAWMAELLRALSPEERALNAGSENSLPDNAPLNDPLLVDAHPPVLEQRVTDFSWGGADSVALDSDRNVDNHARSAQIDQQFSALRTAFAPKAGLQTVNYTALERDLCRATDDLLQRLDARPARISGAERLRRRLPAVKNQIGSMCADGRCNRRIFGDHQFSAGQVLFLAWQMVQSQPSAEKRDLGLENLAIGLSDIGEACTRRATGEVFQALRLSYPDGVVQPPIPFEVARDVMLELSRPIVAGLRASAMPFAFAQRKFFEARLRTALRDHPRIQAPQVAQFLRDFAFADWTGFKKLPAQA